MNTGSPDLEPVLSAVGHCKWKALAHAPDYSASAMEYKSVPQRGSTTKLVHDSQGFRELRFSL